MAEKILTLIVETASSGAVFVTSPDMPGFLHAKMDRFEALTSLPQALNEFEYARGPRVEPAPNPDAAKSVVTSVERLSSLEYATAKIVTAMRSYLPDDGITKDEFINAVIEAVDNPEFNAATGYGADVARADFNFPPLR